MNIEMATQKFVNDLYEAENTLRYGLRLNEAFKTYNDKSSLDAKNRPYYPFDDISDAIWVDCATFTSGGDFNFFGYRGNYEDIHDSSKKCHDLSILDYRPDFWKHVFKQDAIVFSYTTLRKFIGENCSLTSYQRVLLSNLTTISGDGSLFDTVNHGFDFLTQEDNTGSAYYSLETYSPTENGEKILKLSSSHSILTGSDGSATASKYSPNFKRRIRALNKRLDAAGIRTTFSKVEGSENWLSLLEFYDFLVRRDKDCPSDRTGILPIIDALSQGKKFSYSQYENYIACIDHLFKAIGPDFWNDSYEGQTPHKLLVSDKIYLFNQIERLFGLSCIDCIYQNIAPTKGYPYNLCDQDNINLISSCLRLPNVFTRQYILQMAIDTITKHFEYKFGDSDFFSKKATAFDALVTYSHAYNSYMNDFTKLGTWKRQYQRMINYFVQVLFPVYENYFFCVLWNHVKDLNPNIDDDLEIAIKMYQLIRQYLNTPEHTKDLFRSVDIMIDSAPEWKGFNKGNIIQPCFSSGQPNIDPTLYKQCLAAHSLTFKKNAVPDFISLSYFDYLSTALKDKIRTMYILDLTNIKQ